MDQIKNLSAKVTCFNRYRYARKTLFVLSSVEGFFPFVQFANDLDLLQGKTQDMWDTPIRSTGVEVLFVGESVELPPALAIRG